jgi:hypothetical protein
MILLDTLHMKKTKFFDNPILLARKSSSDSGTLYLHKPFKAPDSSKFKEAMLEEINQHIKKKLVISSKTRLTSRHKHSTSYLDHA